MIRALIHIVLMMVSAIVLAVIATILMVIAWPLWYIRRRRARQRRPEIALETLNRRYAFGDIGRIEYLQNRDDILAAQRLAKSQAARSFGEKIKRAWRTLSASDECTGASRAFPP